jgi:hypothetical protein
MSTQLTAILLALMGVAATGSVEPHNYSIRLASAHVFTTRSLHNDTVYASMTVLVNGKPVGTRIWDGVGCYKEGSLPLKPEGRDWNDGDHFFGSCTLSSVEVPTGIVNDGDRIGVRFEVINSSSQLSNENYREAASALEKGLCKSGSDSKDNKGWLCALATIVKIGIPWLTANCNGPLAMDEVEFSATELNKNVPMVIGGPEGQRVWQWGKEYAGTDSPSGCGKNSRYRIDLSIFRLQ